MTTTKDHVRYYYFDAPESIVVPDEWYQVLEIEKERTASNVRDYIKQHTTMPDEYKELVKKYFEDSIQPIQALVDFSSTDGVLNSYPIDVSEKVFVEKTGIVAALAFNEVKKLINEFYHLFLIYTDSSVGYSLVPHFHPHISNSDGSYNRDCRTVTVAIPIKQSSPVEEVFCFNYQANRDITDGNPHDMHHNVDGDILEIKMPTKGQYLLFDFNSTRTLHWLQNDFNQNEYLFIVHQL